MKILSLNTWGARAGHEEFLKFIKSQSDLIDVFCFQEIWHVTDKNGMEVVRELTETIVGGTVLRGVMNDIFAQIEKRLPDHVGFFRPHFKTHYGLAMFVRKDLDLREEGDVFVHKDKSFVPEGDAGHHARNIQYATINTENRLRTVVNFHGLWNGQGKTDTEDRLKQSDNIINFLNNLNNPFIICGDFNLLPNTESLKKFENLGLRNLIKENNITSTRTSFYKKEHKFADYVFVSKGININEFKVMTEEVSDHSPVFLDIN